ncbi:MAG: DNA-directed RNA polymerase subunit omega [Agathobaculum sp.]|jgi:DNA-directed RNA polymerase omega subunit|uniref:DNA-directed RNA polymerase subunit omega n=1 Tax=Agathobaculum sp. TaxID=2048138 RepID=UPI003D8EE5EB
MLKPSMQELMKRVGNRYLLVNLAAQRARDIADEAEENEEQLDDKAVKLALDEIANGSIVYRPGPRTEPVVITQKNAIAAAMIDVDALDLDDEDDEEREDGEDDEKNEDDELEEKRSLDEFADHELDDGDVPEEDR